MVRKTITVILLVLVAVSAICGTAQAYSIYEGTISSTYTTYFKDILSRQTMFTDYVCFRAGQYEYVMVVGDLEYSNNQFVLSEKGSVYTFDNTGSYNSNYSFNVSEISSFSLNAGDNIVYSNLGYYPTLRSQSDYYLFLILAMLFVFLITLVLRNLFKIRGVRR